MSTNVYKDRHISIRQITLGFDCKPGYEILTDDNTARLTEAEFRKMVLELVKHLMEADV